MKRSFMATLADLRNGRTQDDLTTKLNELVKAVSDTGKSGELVLKIKVAPAAKDSRLVKIDDFVTCKAPEQDRAPTLMFPDKDFNLSLSDPEADHRGTLKSIDTPVAKLREVKNG